MSLLLTISNIGQDFLSSGDFYSLSGNLIHQKLPNTFLVKFFFTVQAVKFMSLFFPP